MGLLMIMLTSTNCSYARSYKHRCVYLEQLLEKGGVALRNKKGKHSSSFKMNNLFFRSVTLIYLTFLGVMLLLWPSCPQAGRCTIDPSRGGTMQDLALSRWLTEQERREVPFLWAPWYSHIFSGTAGAWLIAVEGTEGRELQARHWYFMTIGVGMLIAGVGIASGWS